MHPCRLTITDRLLVVTQFHAGWDSWHYLDETWSMNTPFRPQLGWTRRLLRNSDPDPSQIRPFGPYGAGLITAHPVGLLVVAAVVFIALELPEARWFALAAVALGIVFGLMLWLRNR